jgi:hypothetical protein
MVALPLRLLTYYRIVIVFVSHIGFYCRAGLPRMARAVRIQVVEGCVRLAGKQTSRLWQPLNPNLSLDSSSRSFSATALAAHCNLQTSCADTEDCVATMTNNNQQGQQPPDPKTLEKLLSELQDRIERDRQFLAQGEALLARWRATTDRIRARLREVLGPRGWD